MFKLTSASVHYGLSTYPLHGLPKRFETLDSVNALDVEDLAREVGLITGFPREFKARYIPEQAFPGIKTKAGVDLVIPEHIYASANGYSLKWERAA